VKLGEKMDLLARGVQVLWTLAALVPLIIALMRWSKNDPLRDGRRVPKTRFARFASELELLFKPVLDLIKGAGSPYYAQFPKAPSEVTIKELQFVSATIEWTPTPASFFNRDKFQLHVKEMDSDRTWRELDVDHRESFPVTLLDPGTRYRVRVRAYNHKGESPWTEEKIMITPQKRNPQFGGVGPGYTWTQTEDHINVQVNVPVHIKREHVNFVIKEEYIKVEVDGCDFTLEGRLCGHVDPDSSTWELAAPRQYGCDTDRRILILELDKIPYEEDDDNPMPIFMWNCIVEGHPKIEIKKYMGLKQPPESREMKKDLLRATGQL